MHGLHTALGPRIQHPSRMSRPTPRPQGPANGCSCILLSDRESSTLTHFPPRTQAAGACKWLQLHTGFGSRIEHPSRTSRPAPRPQGPANGCSCILYPDPDSNTHPFTYFPPHTGRGGLQMAAVVYCARTQTRVPFTHFPPHTEAAGVCKWLQLHTVPRPRIAHPSRISRPTPRPQGPANRPANCCNCSFKACV